MKFETTIVYDTYWRFAAERQAIFMRRRRGTLTSFTEDKILQNYSFTNTYRASDRVSQFLIKNVIYPSPTKGIADVFFRILLFKTFNSITTWNLLEDKLGSITASNFDFEQAVQILSEEMLSGRRIYSSAYIMPSGSTIFGFSKKHSNHLKLLEQMLNEKLHVNIAGCKSLKSLYELLLSYPTIGPFLAYQYAIDINYSELVNFDESEFVVAGPGAIGGINKCFKNYKKGMESEIINHMFEVQDKEFESRGLNFQTLGGRKLQLIDLQNIFCEVDKYSRVAHPEIADVSGRKRIKRKFNPNLQPIQYFFPPKWGINEHFNMP